ncbi:MAG: ribonuclease III [Opitutales bacterium]|nr:ribonuclease III [Opitutales bacterium]
MADTTQLDAFEKRVGYTFTDKALLGTSLTHPSYIQQDPKLKEHNQRLEFLGDAALSLLLADKLFRSMPKVREGSLTRNRSALAKGDHLANLARELGIPEVLLMSEAEERNDGRNRDSILEDALEALIGAIYLDSNDWTTTQKVVLNWFGDLDQRLNNILMEHNPKGKLQELVQPVLGNESIQYYLIDSDGPSHNRQFTACVEVLGVSWGEGSGSSKKEAEENAARKALAAFENGEVSLPEKDS